MRLVNLVGILMIVVAVIFGVIGAFGLLRWETETRAESISLLPSPTPLPAGPIATPAPGTNPPTSASPGAGASAGAAAGVVIFASKCDACHPKGNAGVGPALHGPEFTARYPDDAALSALIRKGRGGMPAFSTSSLSDNDLDSVIAYLRSLK